jgi:hypothetical protein
MKKTRTNIVLLLRSALCLVLMLSFLSSQSALKILRALETGNNLHTVIFQYSNAGHFTVCETFYNEDLISNEDHDGDERASVAIAHLIFKEDQNSSLISRKICCDDLVREVPLYLLYHSWKWFSQR